MAMTQGEFTMTVLMNDMGWLSRQISDCLRLERRGGHCCWQRLTSSSVYCGDISAETAQLCVIIDFWRFAYAAWPCVWTRELHVTILLQQKNVLWFISRAWRRGLKVLAHDFYLKTFVLFGSLFGLATFTGRKVYRQCFKERGIRPLCELSQLKE